MIKRCLSICALVCLGAMACEAAPVAPAAAVAVSVEPVAPAAAVEAAPKHDVAQAPGGARGVAFKAAAPAPTRHWSIAEQASKPMTIKDHMVRLELQQHEQAARAHAMHLQRAKEKWKARRAKAHEEATTAAASKAEAIVLSVKGEQGAMLR